MDEKKVLGLIAGGGQLPCMVAQGAKAAGYRVVCVGIDESVSEDLKQGVDVFCTAAVARPGSWIRKLRRHGVTDTIMVGSVSKARLHSAGRVLRYIPDWRAFRIFYSRMRHKSSHTDVLLGAVADELATGGIILQDSTKYCQEHMAEEGVLTQSSPTKQALEDIAFGWTIAKTLGDMDIGQAVAVNEKTVIAVEAMEGTAQMIKRAGQFRMAKKWTLIKTSKPNQDMRFDVPCVGPDTIQDLADSGGGCLVIEAGKTIIIDKEKALTLANQLGIVVVAR
ncbi:MAG: UDP-2,3-diacylglucosamine diphosphatase LpxI [Phycisphaerae bacterium]|nr:UDP-2,3-diacylglucosamine diphosphatase LpxI [Phycisphaerae bacterium]